MQSTLTSAAVQSHTAGLLRDGLRLKDYGLSSLFATSDHLRHTPSDEAVRKALHANDPGLVSLERRLDVTLGHTISRSLRCRL